ncbi:hypothetical protein [Sinorhizobium mexicanum]|uniref:hypothetical protein n=1 Tax=Sinorhizobium mexicanum TaxID=375549 RepID=UPI0015DE57ED|nr:hypothetical protein [Sinorhizobium mexicanum]MBP1886400.1 hypothetical protein [Sinorhizobium mexicanum]
MALRFGLPFQPGRRTRYLTKNGEKSARFERTNEGFDVFQGTSLSRKAGKSSDRHRRDLLYSHHPQHSRVVPSRPSTSGTKNSGPKKPSMNSAFLSDVFLQTEIPAMQTTEEIIDEIAFREEEAET